MPKTPEKSRRIGIIPIDNYNPKSNVVKNTISPDLGNLSKVKDYGFDTSLFGETSLNNLNEPLALNQSFLERRARNLSRGLATFGTAAAETIGTIASLPYALSKIGTEEGFIEGLTNNSLMKGIETLHEDILQNQELYYTQDELNDKTISGWLTSGQFADDGVQGLAFLASQFIPMKLIGSLSKSATFLSKIGKSGKILQESGVVSKLLEAKTLKQLSNLSQAEKAAMAAEGIDLVKLQNTIGNIQRINQKVGLGVGAIVGRLGESAMERNQTYNEIYKQQIESGVSEDEAKQIAISQSNNVFLGNLALAALDYQQYTSMFGAFSKSGKKEVISNVTDDATKLLFKDGEKLAAKQLSKAEKLSNYLWGIGKMSSSEAYEELQQYSFQEVAKNAALKYNKTDYTDDILNFLSESIGDLPKSISTLEGQKAAILGGLLGGGMTAINTIGQQTQKQEIANSIATDYNNNAIYEKEKLDPTKRYIKDAEGRTVLNNEYLSGLNRYTQIEERKAIAAKQKDFITWDKLNNLQLFGQVESYKNAGMIEDLKSKYEEYKDLTNEELATQLNTTVDNIQDSRKTTEEILTKIDNYSNLLDNVNSDPTLGALNKDAQKVAATKLFNYEENKHQLNKINSKLLELDAKNTTFIDNTTFDSETDLQQLGNRQSKYESLEGLNPSEQVEYKNLKQQKEDIIKENKEVLNWFTKVRKTDNLIKFNQGIDDFSATKKEELVQSKKDAILQSQSANDFYNDNIIKDNDGFDSSEIELWSDNSNVPISFSLDENDKTVLKSKDGFNLKLDDFLANTAANEGKYVQIDENGEQGSFTVKINPVNSIRTNRINKQEIEKTEAAIQALEIAREDLNRSINNIENNSFTKLQNAYKKLDVLTKKLSLFSNNYKQTREEVIALVKEKQELENQITELEKEVNASEINYSNVLEGLDYLKTQRDKITNQINILKKEISVAKQKKGVRYKSEFFDKYNKQLTTTNGLIKDIEDIVNDLQTSIKEKKEYLGNLYKVLEAINQFIEKSLYDMIGENNIINQILNDKGINTTTDLVNWFKNYNDGYKTNSKAEQTEFIETFVEVLGIIKDSDLKKYTNELNKLKREIKALETEIDKINDNKEYKLLKTNSKRFEKVLKDYSDILANKQRVKTVVNKGEETILVSEAKDYDEGKDIAVYGMFLTAGNDLPTYKEVGNKEAVKTLNPNPDQNNFFRWLEHESHNYKPSQLQLMTVHINDSVYGKGKKDSIFNDITDDSQYDNVDNIRLILIDKSTGKPITYLNGLPVSTNLRTSENLNFSNGAGKYYSSEFEKGSKEYKEQIKNAQIELEKIRTLIKENPNKNYFTNVTELNRGRTVNNDKPTTIVGSLIKDLSDKETNKIEIVPVTIAVQKGKRFVDIPLGHVVIKDTNSDNNFTTAITRKLNTNEANTVLFLVKQYIKTYNETIGSDEIKHKAANVLNPSNTSKTNTDWSVLTYIKNIVYLNSKSINPISIESGKLFINDKLIEVEELLSGELDQSIITHLLQKPLQVNTNANVNNKKYQEAVLENGKIKIYNHPSYKHYLLTGTKDAQGNLINEAPLKVMVKPNINPSQADIATKGEIRRFVNGSIAFSKDFVAAGEKTTENSVKKVDFTKPDLTETISTETNDKTTKTYSSDKGDITLTYEGDKLTNILIENNETAEHNTNILNQVLTKEGGQKQVENLLKTFNAVEITEKFEEKEVEVIPFVNALNINFDEIETKIVDKTKLPLLDKVYSNNGTLINLDEARQNLANLLGIDFEEINGELIDGIAGGRILQDGRILLSSLAEKGTEFHEAFHRVSQFMIKPEQKQKLYDEYRKRTGFNGNNKATEEMLADDFMDYMLDGSKNIPTIEKSLFNKIIDFISKIFNLNNQYKTNDNIYNLFESIKRGEFKNQPMINTSMDYMMLNSVQHDKALQLHAFFTEVLLDPAYKGKALYKLSHEGINSLEPFYTYIFDNYYQPMKQELKDAMVAQHGIYLKSLGINAKTRKIGIDKDGNEFLVDDFDTDSEYNDKLENNDINAYESYTKGSSYKESFTKSVSSNMYKSIKFIISSVTETVKNDKTGKMEIRAVDFVKLVNKIANLSADSISYDQMMNKLKSSGDAQIQQVVQKLGVWEQDFSWNEIEPFRSFNEVFAKNKNNFFKTLKYEEVLNNKKTGTIKYKAVSGNTTKKENNLKQEFLNIINTSTDGIMIDKGIRKMIPSIQEYKITTVENAIQVLSGLGIEYFNNYLDEINDIKGFGQELVEWVKQLQKDNNLIPAFDGTVDNARLKRVLSLAAQLTPEIVESSASTATGVTVHGLQNNSFFTDTMNSLKNGIIPSHLEGDMYATDSMILKVVKDKTHTVEVGVLTGITDDINQGEETSSLHFNDFLKQEFISVIDGNFPLLPTSSLTTARTYSIVNKKNNRNMLYLDPKGLSMENIKAELVERLVSYYDTDKNLIPDEANQGEYIVNGTDKLGKITLFNDIVKSDKTKVEDITDYVNQLVDETIEFLKDNHIVTKTYNPVNTNVLDNVFGKGVDSDTIVAGFVANYMISNIEQTKVIFGHPALFKVKNDKVDMIDMLKRYRGTVGETTPLIIDETVNQWMDKNMPRLDGKTRTVTGDSNLDNTFALVTVEDVKSSLADTVGAAQKELKELYIAEYGNNEEADAFGLVFDDFYRDFRFRSNRWEQFENDNWVKENNGEKPDDNYFTPPLKPLINGSQSRSTFLPIFGKTAFLRISKSLIDSLTQKDDKGNLIYPQLKYLMDNISELNKQGVYLDVVLFSSATKVGAKKNKTTGKLQPFYDKEGKIAKIDTNYIVNVPLETLGIITENKITDDKKSVTAGSQVAVIQLGNTYNEGVAVDENIVVDGKTISIKDAVEEYQNVQNELTDSIRHKLEKDLDIVHTAQGTKFKNNGLKFKNFLYSQINDTRHSQNNIEGLEEALRELNETNDIVLESLVNYKKIENVLSSIVESRIVAQKRFGKAMVQFPSSGLELQARKYDEKTDTYIANGLEFYTNKDGKHVIQVYLPYYFKGVPMTIDKYDSKLKQMFGFRIPTEQLNSIDVIEVVGFLPKSYANTVIVPSGISTKVGSDFDFDKINIYYPNFDENNKYIEYNEENLNNGYLRTRALQNRLLELSIGIVSADFRKIQHLQPNSVKQIKDVVVANIRKAKNKLGINEKDYTDYKLSDLFSFKVISDLKNKFWYGKSLVGMAALHNKNHIFGQIAGLELNGIFKDKPVDINFQGIDKNDKGNYPLGKINDTDGNLITATLGQTVSVVVDIEKNPDILPVLNLNSDTINTAMLLNRLGVSSENVYYFLSQPVLMEYVDLIQKGNLSKSEIKKNLQDKYKKEVKDKSTWLFTKEQLLSYDSKYQAQVFADFLNYEELGNELSNFQSSVSFDTKGFRNNVELKLNINKYNKAKDNELFVNRDKYIDSYLKGFIDNVSATTNYWNSLFLTQRLPQEIDEQITNFYNNFSEKWGKNEKKVQLAMLFKEDLLSYMLQRAETNNGKMVDKYDYLFKGENSLPKRLSKFIKNNPQFINLRTIVPILTNTENELKETKDNLKINNKKLSPQEIDNIADNIKDIINLDMQLALDLFDFQIMQSGFNTTTLSYLSVLPNINKNVQTGQPMFGFKNYISNLFSNFNMNELDFEEFKTLFYLNNYTNEILVPFLKKNVSYENGFAEYYYVINPNTGLLTVPENRRNNEAVKTGNKEEGITIWVSVEKTDADGNIINKGLYRPLQPRGSTRIGKDYRPLQKTITKPTNLEKTTNKTVENNQPTSLPLEAKKRIVQELASYYNSLSVTRKLELKQKIMLTGDTNIINDVEDFKMYSMDIISAVLIKSPNITESDLKKEVSETLKKCFKG